MTHYTDASGMTSGAHESGLLEAFWRFRWSSLLIVLACTLAAIAFSLLARDDVTVSARMAVTDPRATTFLRQGVGSDVSFVAYTNQRAAFAETAPVLERAASIAAGTGGSRQLSLGQTRDAVNTSVDRDGGIINVVATGPDRPAAASLANAVMKAYAELTTRDVLEQQRRLIAGLRASEDRVRRELEATGSASDPTVQPLSEALAQLQLKQSDVNVDVAQYGSGVRFVDEAEPVGDAPSTLPRNAALGFAMGVLVALVVAFLRATGPSARALGGVATSMPGEQFGPAPRESWRGGRGASALDAAPAAASSAAATGTGLPLTPPVAEHEVGPPRAASLFGRDVPQ